MPSNLRSEDLAQYIKDNFGDDLEVQLRMLIVFAREEGSLPKDRYVQAILNLIASKMEELYQPEITDLEANEYKGEDRPVVYLDSVKSILKGGTE